MTDRPGSSPPLLPGFSYEKWLGGGGFADVFLYRQHRPARPVAVKVLRAEGLAEDARRAFDSEADLMARVSAHPYIVQIFDAAVAPDGRPYLLMEYYPKPHYGRRCREQPLDVQQMLRVGVRIASAVETAHRAGILHRDIKPANILVSEYDRPGLTDFGIAGTRDAAGMAESQGLTVGYAPPEVLAQEAPGDERSDVYSLGATLYALIAGHAPFEVRGGDNSDRAQILRALREPVPPLQVDGAPRSLGLLLEHALAKDPRSRPRSAESLARSMQAVEQELRLAPTEFELAVVESPAARRANGDADADATRSGIQVVRPDTAMRGRLIDDARPKHLSAPAPVPLPERPLVLPDPPTVGKTARRPLAAVPAAAAAEEPAVRPSARGRRSAAVAAAGGALLLLLAIGAVLAAGRDAPSEAPGSATTAVRGDALVLLDVPPVPSGLAMVRVDAGVRVTWSAPGAKEGDTYLVARVDANHVDEPATRTRDLSLEVAGVSASDTACFQVLAERGSRQSEPSERACTA